MKRDPSASFYETQDLWLIKKDEAHDPQVLLNFVNKGLRNSVPLKVPFLTVLINNVILFTLLGCLIVFVKRPISITY